MTGSVVVGMCMGIAGLVVVLCAWMVHESERRLEIVEELLASADARAARFQDIAEKQAELIDDMNRHIADVSEGWVTYQRSHNYKAIAPVQVIKIWEC